MIPDEESMIRKEPIPQPKPHTDECIEWLEAHEPRPFGIEW